MSTASNHAVLHGGFRTWLDHHLFSLFRSVGNMVRKPIGALLTILVMAIALALPLGLLVSLANVDRFAGNVQQAREISVFLKPEVTVAQASELADQWRSRPDVARLDFITPEQGLDNLKQNTSLGPTLDNMADTPLPSLLIVVPRGDENKLAASLKQFPQVDIVEHDQAWRDRLNGWLEFGRTIALVLAGLLGLGAVLIVGNSVRADIQAHREEIGVLQHLGATDGFIRRPFLYLGAVLGVLAGLAALGLLTLANYYLSPSLAQLASTYGSRFALQGFNFVQATGIVIVAGLLGWLGAGLVTGHYLRETRPNQ